MGMGTVKNDKIVLAKRFFDWRKDLHSQKVYFKFFRNHLSAERNPIPIIRTFGVQFLLFKEAVNITRWRIAHWTWNVDWWFIRFYPKLKWKEFLWRKDFSKRNFILRAAESNRNSSCIFPRLAGESPFEKDFLTWKFQLFLCDFYLQRVIKVTVQYQTG